MRVCQALLAVLLFLAVSGVGSETVAEEPVRDFNRYVQLLLERHPDLRSLEAALEAARQIPEYAYSLEDPQIKLGAANLPYGSLSFSDEGMTQKQVGVMQKFPAFGKRGLRRKVAEDSVKIAAAMIPEKRLELIEMARVLSYRLNYLQKARRILIKNKEILRGFIQIALTKYSVGKGLQSDVLLAQVELSRMSDLLMRVEQKIRSTGDMLAVMADLPIDTDWSLFHVAPLLPIAGRTDKLLEEALVKRPIFKKLDVEIKRAENVTRLARRDLLPDYAVGLAYGQRDSGPAGERDDMVSASITMSIPVWHSSRQDKKIAEAVLLTDRARHEFTSEKWNVRYRIADLLEIEEKNLELLVLYETGLLPQASQTVEASLAAYQVNKVDFLTLVTNQIAFYNFEIVRDRIEFELQAARARMLRTLGEYGTEVFNNGR